MRKLIASCAIFACVNFCVRADDTPPEASVQLRPGLRMKLVPPPAPPKNAGGGEDPLAPITDKMSDIVGDLADKDTGKPVQAKQQEVVSSLDAIIKQLEQQKSKQGNGGGNNPTKPMNDSRIASGPGGIGDLHDPRSGTHNINNLPPKLRDTIIQSKTEGFPPGYESLLQSYYQRLAQEKVGDESTATKPPTKPAP